MAETQAPIEEVEARLRVSLSDMRLGTTFLYNDVRRILDELDRRERQVVGLRLAVAMKWSGIVLWVVGAFLWGRWAR